MYLSDTDLQSELTTPRTNATLVRKLLACDRAPHSASEMSRCELRYGAALRPHDTVSGPHIERSMALQAPLVAPSQGARVEWIDSFGNDTMAIVPVGVV